MKDGQQLDGIDDDVQYLLEKKRFLDFWVKPSRETLDEHPDAAGLFHDYDAIKTELDSATADLMRAYSRLSNLRRHFSKGELRPFDSMGAPISTATTCTAKACAELEIAKARLMHEHPPKTRELELQRTAVRIAYARLHIRDPRGVRAAAKQMLLRAGIVQPSERSLTAWISEERANDSLD
ncbi:MAG: hypothetical protein KGZ67_02075 [Hydrogenophaga sp.]|nr:hypothetical protein [Hydrogenophaga sp.]